MEIPEEGGEPVLALARIKFSSDNTPPLRAHVTVQTRTIDEIVERYRMPVSLIKCDVEMHELEVLEGALSTIQRDRPAIYAELQPDLPKKPSQRNAVKAMLLKEGYAPHVCTGEFVRSGDDALDVLFLTPTHLQQLRELRPTY
jgi:hypothetical protein